MSELQNLVLGLRNQNNKEAYHCLKQLESKSLDSDRVYFYFDYFATMLDDPNSYIRTRAIILIAANAKWDNENKIDKIIDSYLKHILDNKPITARQTIKILPTIAKYKPNLINDICSALHQADPLIYENSMQQLVCKDIKEALNNIANIINRTNI